MVKKVQAVGSYALFASTDSSTQGLFNLVLSYSHILVTYYCIPAYDLVDQYQGTTILYDLSSFPFLFLFSSCPSPYFARASAGIDITPDLGLVSYTRSYYTSSSRVWRVRLTWTRDRRIADSTLNVVLASEVHAN